MRSALHAVLAALLGVLVQFVGLQPALAQAVDCTVSMPAEWQVITAASGGGEMEFLCNYRVNRKPPGMTTTLESGVAITTEYYCTPAEGTEAFKSKTNPRDTDVLRDEGTRVVMQEGPDAKNPDNRQGQQVFSQYFNDAFRLFEKEWLALNSQTVATIVVLTNEKNRVPEDKRFGVDDAEGQAAALAAAHVPKTGDCRIASDYPGVRGGSIPGGGGGEQSGVGGSIPGGIGGDRSGEIPIAVVLAGAGAGGTVVVILVTKGGKRRRVMMKPRKQYPGGRPNVWDPDDPERARRWNKEGLVWDDTTLTWRPPREGDFIDVLDDPTTRTSEIPSPCQPLHQQYLSKQSDVRWIDALIEEQNAELKKARQIYRLNLARANVLIGWEVVQGATAVVSGVLGGAKTATRVTSLVRRVKVTKFDLNVEYERLLAKRPRVHAEFDNMKKRVARLDHEFSQAVEDSVKARRALKAAEANADTLERQAKQAIVDESPPPELTKRKAENTAAQRFRKQEIDELKDIDPDMANRASQFDMDTHDSWVASNDYENITRDIKEARAARDAFYDSPDGQLSKLLEQTAEELQAKRITQAQADEIYASIPKDALAEFRRVQKKLGDQVVSFSKKQADFHKNFRARQPGYDPNMEGYFGGNRASDLVDLRQKLARLEAKQVEIDAEIEQFQNAAIAKNKHLLDEAARARREALDQADDVARRGEIERAAGRDLKAATTDLALKQSAVGEVDDRMKQIQRALASLDAEEPPPIAPVRIVGTLLYPIGWVIEKGWGVLPNPKEILQTLLQNKHAVTQIEEIIAGHRKVHNKKIQESIDLMERLKICIATNRPQSTMSGGR